MQFTLDEILTATNGQLIHGNRDQKIRGISTDSRTISSGDLFVPIVGENFDGHNFIETAIENGAIGTLITRGDLTFSKRGLIIEVDDTLTAFGQIANFHRRRFDLPIIAITGSNGKTTTKEMIASVLDQRFRVFKTDRNFNNRIGVPQQLLKLNENDEIAVIEIGTNQPGEIRKLTKILDPNVAIITNIAESHLEFLGSIEGVAIEKSAVLENVSIAFLNADDDQTPNLRSKTRGKVITFGCDENADVFAKAIRIDPLGRPIFDLRSKIGDLKSEIKLLCFGRHNVSNALAAASVGIWAGLTIDEIRSGLENFASPEMRTQLLEIEFDGKKIKLINDAYNANPISTRSSLRLLSEISVIGKRIAILGDMLELGENSDQLHAQTGRDLPKNLDLLITIGEKSRHIYSAVNLQIDKIRCETIEEVVDNLRQSVGSGDAVLIKASRGMALEKIVSELK